MNSSKAKKINKHSKEILIAWLRENVAKEEGKLLTVDNVEKFLPQEKYIYYNRRINLNAYTVRWVKQIIKKMLRNKYTLNNITMNDVEKYINED